jgi:hypothetical protein
MGLVCNNVLHDRAGFIDDPLQPRLAVPGPLPGPHFMDPFVVPPTASSAVAR